VLIVLSDTAQCGVECIKNNTITYSTDGALEDSILMVMSQREREIILLKKKEIRKLKR